MDRIIFPLRPEMRSPEVGNLQDALRLLLDEGVIRPHGEDARRELTAGLRRERAAQGYGSATRKLVAVFQEGRQLEASGTVDEPTAQALNTVLGELGAFGPTTADRQRLVAGQVQRKDGQPSRGAVVRAFHVAEHGLLRLGEDTTDAEGRYTIRYSSLPSVAAVDLRVAVFDSGGRPLREADIIRKAKPVEIVDLVVPVAARATFLVEGRVASRFTAAVGGLRIQVVDKTVGKDVLLTKTVTDPGGAYRATFNDFSLQKRGKARPDLQARVFADDTFLAASGVRYNASRREVLNVLLGEKAASVLQSEYETLTGALSSHFRDSLGNLEETGDRKDITYLANKTGWDARAVALAALADQFSARTCDDMSRSGLEPALFYALFRAGLPANEHALYQISPKTAETVWRRAIKQGVIPAGLESGLPDAVERFQKLAAQQLLDSPALVGVSSLKELLSISLGDDTDRQEQFTDLYARHRGDLPQFWQTLKDAFDGEEIPEHLKEMPERLKLDGQLAYLTLNNAPLIRKLHGDNTQTRLTDTLDLVENGYYRAEAWKDLAADCPIPPEISGADDDEKRERYAELLAAQVRLSFPTAVVAKMVVADETPLTDSELKEGVRTFLTSQQGRFEIGMQPVARYVARNSDLQVASEVIKEVTRIQRVYQITPSDDAMNALLREGMDSAYAVAHCNRDKFVRTFEGKVGGEVNAKAIHAKSQQVYNATLNIAVSYLTARIAPGIGRHSPPRVLDPAPHPHASDVIAYPTLEGLLGDIDYCDCDHCRSVLGPAAYLVNLLQFIDRPSDSSDFENPQTVLFQRRPDIKHLPLTCENTTTPVPYIDLVNETLEYYVAADSDSVPENKEMSLEGYRGHNTDDSATPEELLANPMFVNDKAYKTLLAAHFPPPLPLHRSLENLRRYFDRFEAPLPRVMEALREHDEPEDAEESEDPRHDILMEELRLSRQECRLFTDSSLTLQQLYGYPSATSDEEALSDLSKAKQFARRFGISYEDLVEILKTRFVNPSSTLVPRLERLGVSFDTLAKFMDGERTDEWFDAKLAPHLDESQYGGDIKAWVKNEENYAHIMGLLTLLDLGDSENADTFDKLEFRYANPDNSTNQIRRFEFFRLIRFIRLWKKLGWTIDQTDKAITAIYPTDKVPAGEDEEVDLQKLIDGFEYLLPRLGVVKRVMDLLELKPERGLLPLLACFAPIDTHGDRSLYRQMFLRPAMLEHDDAFADDGYGNFLKTVSVDYEHNQADLEEAIIDAGQGKIAYDGSRKRLSYTGELDAEIRDALKTVPDATPKFTKAVDALYAAKKLLTHTEAMRAAFDLTGEEFSQITGALGFKPDTDTPLTIENVSKVFRRGWLARKLKLSVQEFLKLTQVTGIEPFDLEKPDAPPIVRLIELVNRLRALSLKPTQALYLIWNEDISGKYAPPDSEHRDCALSLRSDLDAVESEFAPTEDPEGQIARARMALVYGEEATQFFFSLLENTLVTEVQYNRGPVNLLVTVEYTHGQETLEQNILDAASGHIQYDHTQKQLSFTGVLTQATCSALKKDGAGVTDPFKQAVDKLLAENQKVVQANLEQPIVNVAPGRIAYDDFRKQLSYTGIMADAISTQLQALDGATTEFQEAVDKLHDDSQAAVEPFFGRYPELRTIYEAHTGDSQDDRRSALLASLLPELKRQRKRQQALQTISDKTRSEVAFASALLADKVKEEDRYVLHASGEKTRPALDDLMALETPDIEESGEQICNGYLAVPENDFYNLRVETDKDATVTLTLDGEEVDLKAREGIYSSETPTELRAGQLYDFSLTVENAESKPQISWETRGRGWEIIPVRHLYSPGVIDNLRNVYVRFRKIASLAGALDLTAPEAAWLGSHHDHQIDGQGWLNSLPVATNSDAEEPDAESPEYDKTKLLEAFTTVLDYARVKADLTPDDDSLLTILRDPAAATEEPDSLLFSLAGWEPESLDALLDHFGKANRQALEDLGTFCRVYDAYAFVKKLGVSASALIEAATSDRCASTVRNLQAALRARYDESDWLDVLKPINDEMRGLQRDALVAHILNHMRGTEGARHIDTADKLFEYFLMDVQMEPCMQTSRVRNAISSVQLFIERCLMKLEDRVDPAAIDAKQWEWMNRYRVWEANRKVFLYPENWLEPELRDNQSPFFKEIMSELLQSDITEDKASAALLNYLAKLEEVAKLEPCGIYYVEDDPTTDIGEDVAHVVARTAGANRKYFYRRREDACWTPWEQITLDIEDDPVVPVIWTGRLFLFWLRILKQAPMDPQAMSTASTSQEPLNELKLENLKADAQASAQSNTKVTVQAVLCWSEYYNGKWQSTKTSDVNRPITLNRFAAAGKKAFERSTVRLWARKAEDEKALIIEIYGAGATGDPVPGFTLYNSHSLPVRREDDGSAMHASAVVEALPMRLRRFVPPPAEAPNPDTVTIEYRTWTKSEPMNRELVKVKDAMDYRVIGPNYRFRGAWAGPFFFADGHHVFYVSTTEERVPISKANDFGTTMRQDDKIKTYRPLLYECAPFLELRPDMGPHDPTGDLDPGVVDPSPVERLVAEDPYISNFIRTTETVPYDGTEIGPMGGFMGSVQ